ncbi:hypothetical protein AGMMS49921_01210 [Endomicrobiia bacterium]|nr:hypothetical protein AGMMS49921_01210 [Endomicrobiia bacterium]
MKLKQCLSIFVEFSLVLSSCDKKNAGIVNRRTATPEKVEEIKRTKAKDDDKGHKPPQPKLQLPPITEKKLDYHKIVY